MLEKLREGYENRAIGYYFTAGITLVSLVAAIVYAVGYNGTDYISWLAFVFLLAVFVGNLALMSLGKAKWAPLASIVFITLAVCFFIYGIYFYVSVVFVGIDIANFDARFILNTVLFVLLLGFSIANIFLSQEK